MWEALAKLLNELLASVDREVCLYNGMGHLCVCVHVCVCAIVHKLRTATLRIVFNSTMRFRLLHPFILKVYEKDL